MTKKENIFTKQRAFTLFRTDKSIDTYKNFGPPKWRAEAVRVYAFVSAFQFNQTVNWKATVLVCVPTLYLTRIT